MVFFFLVLTVSNTHSLSTLDNEMESYDFLNLLHKFNQGYIRVITYLALSSIYCIHTFNLLQQVSRLHT